MLERRPIHADGNLLHGPRDDAGVDLRDGLFSAAELDHLVGYFARLVERQLLRPGPPAAASMSRNALHCGWSAMGPPYTPDRPEYDLETMSHTHARSGSCRQYWRWWRCTSSLAAQDWPQWRGPDRDGVITAFREPASWPKSLNKRWQVEVGTGLCDAARRRRADLRLHSPGRRRGDDRARRPVRRR